MAEKRGRKRKRTPSVERRARLRRRVLALRAEGLTRAEIARRVGYSWTWVAELIERARPGGPKHRPSDEG